MASSLTIADIRKKYPQSNSLTDDQLIEVVANQYGASVDEMKTILSYEAPAPRGRTFGDVASDVLVTATKSAVGLPQAFVGLIDIPTGGRVGKALEEIGYRPNETQAMLSDMYSDPQKAANKRVADAQGFTDTALEYVKNPSTIATTVGESAGQMLGGAGAARSLIGLFPKLAPWAAGALGEGIVGAGSAEEQLRAESPDGLTTARQGAAALASGAGTAIFGAAGGKVAKKLGIADVDTMLASGVAAPKTVGFLKAAATSGISEGVLEEMPQSAWEQMMQNYAQDKPILDGVAKAMSSGLVAGVAMGGGAGAFNSLVSKNEVPKIEPPKVIMDQPDVDSVISAAESSIEQIPVQQKVSAPIDDPMRLEVINRLPEAFRDSALRAYNIITDENAPKGIKKQNQRLLDDILEQAASEMQPVITAPTEEIQPPAQAQTEVAPIGFGSNQEEVDAQIAIEEQKAQERARVLSEIENTDSRVAFQAEQERTSKRNEIIDQILSSDAAIGMRPAKLADMVKVSMAEQGYANPVLNDTEFARIKRFADIARAEPIAETIPETNLEGQAPSSSLSELIPEKKQSASQSDAIVKTSLPDNLIEIAQSSKTPTEFFKALNGLKIPLGQRAPLMAAYKEMKKNAESAPITPTAIPESTIPQSTAIENTVAPDTNTKQAESSVVPTTEIPSSATDIAPTETPKSSSSSTTAVQQTEIPISKNGIAPTEIPNGASSITPTAIPVSETIKTSDVVDSSENTQSASNQDTPTAIPSTAIPETTLRDNGTLSIKGDTKALQTQLKEAGIPSLPSKEGVTVGVKNVAKAQEFIASLESSNQVDEVRPVPTNQDPVVANAEKITKDSSLADGTTIQDGEGNQYRVHYQRNNLVIAHPIVDGKAQVNADTTVRFWVNEDSTPSGDNDRTDPIFKADTGVKVSNPAQQTTAQKGLSVPYKKGKTGAETARNKLAYENPFLSFLATHGVSIQDRADVGGEKGRARLIPGHGPLFRKNGLRLDELAQMAVEKGFITQAQMDSDTDNGGVNALSEMIGKALRNEVVTGVKDVIENRSVDQELMQEAESIGIDITGKTSDEVYDLVKEYHDEKLYQEAVDILNELSEAAKESSQEYNLQELIFDVEDLNNAEEDSTRGERAPSSTTARGTSEAEKSSRSTPETSTEQTQEGNGSGGDQSFGLTGETTQEANARIAKEEADAKAKEAETAKQDDADRKARIKKEIDSRQESSAENFQLGQSAEDSLSGQQDIFSSNPNEAAKEQIHASDLTPSEKLANIAAVNRGDVSPDDIAKVLDRKKDDQLYSKTKSSGAESQEVRGRIAEEVGSKFRQLVKENGDAFQFDKLTGDKNLDKTLKQIGIPTGVSELTKDNPKWRDGQDQQWQIKSASGDVAYVYRKSNEVQINVLDLKSAKSKGTEIYQAVESWAFANNYKFIGDDQGITRAGQVRRTENMISSILRHDSIDHVKPHEDSKLPVDKGGLDIQWHGGNRDRSLGELLVASYKNIERVIPEIKYVHATEYGDFEYRGSPEHNDGDLFTGDDLKALANKYKERELARAGEVASKASRVGNSTLTRAIYTGTLYRSAIASHGAELHDRSGSQGASRAAGRIGPESLTKALYSRNDQSSGKTVSDFASLAKKYNDKINKNGFELVVVQSESDLPNNSNQVESSSGEIIEGAYLNGDTAYIVADSIKDNKRFDEVAQHELSHLATEKLLTTEEWARGLKSIQTLEKMKNKTLTKLGKQVDENQPGLDADTRAKEIAALLVETGEYKNVSVLNKLVSSLTMKLKAMLRGMGLSNDWVNNLNEGEVSALMRDAMGRLYGNASIKNKDSDPGTLFSKAQANSANPHSWNAPEPSRFDDLLYKFQDKHIDTKRVVDAIDKTISDDLNVYQKEELHHNSVAARLKEFINGEQRPLLKLMKQFDIDMETLQEYMHARHAEEANIMIAWRNRDTGILKDGGSGMKTADARKYLASLSPAQKKKLEALATKVDSIIAKTRQLYIEYGLEPKSVVDGWADMFDFYVPLMREQDGESSGMGIGQGFSVKGKEVKGRTGSTRKVVDIFANIAMQREKVIVRGEKNKVAKALYELAKANPNKEFWRVEKPETTRVYNQDTDTVVEQTNPMFKNNSNVIVAKIKDAKGNVEEKAIIFNEENPRALRMAEALKNLDTTQMSGFMGLMAGVTRYLAAINTQYNPVFGLKNLVRDLQGAMVNLTSTDLKNHKADVFKNVWPAMKAIYLDERAGKRGEKENSEMAALWREFELEGGPTGYREMFANSADRAAAIERELNPTKWMDSPLGKVFTAGGALKVPLAQAQKQAAGLFGWIEDYNNAIENSVRLASYKVGKEQGLSNAKAASLAKNLTVNFNRKGQSAQQVGALYAFFNASIQGTARHAKTLFTIEDGDVKTIRLSSMGKKIVYGGISLGVIQALMLSAAGFDDDEPPQFVRERNFIIPTGGKSYISIPLALGLHVLPNLGRIPTEFALGGFKRPADKIFNLMGLTIGAFNPTGGGGSLLQAISPTAIDPIAAISENKDWTGKAIAKTSHNKAIPGHALMRDTASYPSKLIAEGINFLTGGTQYTAGAISPTPDQIDYLFGQVTGGVGREVVKLQQAAVTPFTGEDLPVSKVPIVGMFYGNTDTPSAQANKFYTNLDRLNEYETEIKGMIKDRKGLEVARYIRENPEARLYQMANQVERDVQELRQQKRELMKAKADSSRIKMIENQIALRMAQFNRMVDQAAKDRLSAINP